MREDQVQTISGGLSCACTHDRVCGFCMMALPDEYSAEIELAKSLEKLQAENDELKKQKDIAYSERNKLVCALSKLFPATLERHPDNEPWEDDWRWIVYINLPAGQASWHIHDSQIKMFNHLERLVGTVFDGHSTDEKYRRLEALAKIKGEAK